MKELIMLAKVEVIPLIMVEKVLAEEVAMLEDITDEVEITPLTSEVIVLLFIDSELVVVDTGTLVVAITPFTLVVQV